MSQYNIPYVQVAKQYEEEARELEPIVIAALRDGNYIGGTAVEKLEEELAELCEVKHAVALNSGTDALIFGMMALGIGEGDEVITPPNSFVASTASVIRVGAKPVFADVLPDQNIDPDAIEAAITPRTKAIMPVHLTGRVCQMDRIQKIAEKYNLAVIEDAAQSIGSLYNSKKSGSFGNVGCFSLHPLKNLNACGDSGFLTTNDSQIAERIKRLRNHGMSDRVTVEEWGFVSRMDTIQAEVIRFRLKKLDSVTEKRRANAKYYQSNLSVESIFMPGCREQEYNTFHTFVIQIPHVRDELQQYLANIGIKTTIHYPIPIHLQPAAKGLGYKKGDFPVTERQSGEILTLPVNQYLTHAEQDIIISKIHEFMQKQAAAA